MHIQVVHNTLQHILIQTDSVVNKGNIGKVKEFLSTLKGEGGAYVELSDGDANRSACIQLGFFERYK